MMSSCLGNHSAFFYRLNTNPGIVKLLSICRLVLKTRLI